MIIPIDYVYGDVYGDEYEFDCNDARNFEEFKAMIDEIFLEIAIKKKKIIKLPVLYRIEDEDDTNGIIE